MNAIAPLAGLAALLASGVAFGHHPSHPAESVSWWELVVAGAVALVALWIVGRIRQRAGKRRAAAKGSEPSNRFTGAA